MQPKNVPYYRGPCYQKPTTEGITANTMHIQSLLMDITTSTGWGHTHLSNVPVCFGETEPTFLAATPSLTLLNLKLARYERQAMKFNWAIYSF